MCGISCFKNRMKQQGCRTFTMRVKQKKYKQKRNAYGVKTIRAT